MPKYYCEYCKSYLTHDTMSVRKSHLMGKYHIKYYCDYYEDKAKETGVWDPSDTKYEMGLSKLNEAAPGGQGVSSEVDVLPPPPTLDELPNPPPSVLNFTEEYKKLIYVNRVNDRVV